MSVDVQGKSLVELLDMLAPAPVPEPISMAPQTWGWVVLFFVLAVALAGGAYAFHQHRRQNAYRRSALSDLEDAGRDAAKIAEILRRTALAAYPREKVAGLYGQDWLNFLSQTSDKILISKPQAEALAQSPYRYNSRETDIATVARDWIRTHKAERRQK
ncbi:MAG: DUF4381 domain-containing protein [Arenibacterium sp.]